MTDLEVAVRALAEADAEWLVVVHRYAEEWRKPHPDTLAASRLLSLRSLLWERREAAAERVLALGRALLEGKAAA